jgi:phosphoglycolate phosphatase
LVVFDLDGTLIDSQEGITLSVQYALHVVGIDEPDLVRLTRFIGPPLIDSFRTRYGMDDATSARALAAFRERFAAQGINENTVYPGVPDLLWTLRASGVTLALATTKDQAFAEQILMDAGLLHYFWRVVGGTADGSRVIKVDLIAAVLDGVAAEARQRAVMVGDHPLDIEGARANGLDVIAVAYGFGDPDQLREANPDHLINTVPALMQFLLGD